MGCLCKCRDAENFSNPKSLTPSLNAYIIPIMTEKWVASHCFLWSFLSSRILIRSKSRRSVKFDPNNSGKMMWQYIDHTWHLGFGSQIERWFQSHTDIVWFWSEMTRPNHVIKQHILKLTFDDWTYAELLAFTGDKHTLKLKVRGVRICMIVWA